MTGTATARTKVRANPITFTLAAKPYEARQCPECKLWIYTAAGPFAENDQTKPMADAIHYETVHADLVEQRGTNPAIPSIGFPYFQYNDVQIEGAQYTGVITKIIWHDDSEFVGIVTRRGKKAWHITVADGRTLGLPFGGIKSVVEGGQAILDQMGVQ